MKNATFLFRVHAVQRMFERHISVKRVVQVVQSGQTIEDYSSEMPEPSRLILGFQGGRPLHVVTSENQKTGETTIITAYVPSPDKWDNDFTSRSS